jgi:hypothetical protein
MVLKAFITLFLVFRVGGAINGAFTVPGDTTLAGQTAPGQGDEKSAIPGLKLDSPAEYMPIRQQTVEEAYDTILL